MQQSANSNQPALPFERALLYLASRARARTPLGAGEYLVCLRHHARENYDKRLTVAVDCLSIYRQAFPEQYARSTAPAFSVQREHEFYKLVHTQCFPLVVDEQTDLLTYLEREPRFFLPFIPVRGLQRYEWLPGAFDYSEIDVPYQLALLLSAILPDEIGKTEGPITVGGLTFPADFPRPALPLGGLGWSLFVHALKTEDSPLAYLPAAFELITYKTGNTWLDMPRQVSYLGHAWSPERVAELAVMRAKADQYDIAMRKLHNWLREDLPTRLTRAVTLWNTASAREAEWGYEGLTGDEFMEAAVGRGLGVPMPNQMMALPPGELDRLWAGNERELYT
jgi:hypothetical protein